MSLVNMLIDAGIVKIKSPDEELFTLKSGKKSRLFIDIKEASLSPKILRRITQLSIEVIQEETALALINTNHPDLPLFLFDKIGSVAIGGIPIATALSLETMTPQIIVRSEKHDRGTKSQIIGDCKGKRVLLIEDVATSGSSIVSAVKAIRDAGGICSECIVVVSREEGAEGLCEENRINLFPLLKKSDFGITEEI